jgi:glutathione S-transferase
MIVLETTARCVRVPIVLFALEEAGLEYRIETRPSGWFLERHLTAGPRVIDGEIEVLELDAILRHLARTSRNQDLFSSDPRELAEIDRWMELQAALRAAIAAKDRAEVIRRRIDALDRALDGKPYLLGRFTIADCPAAMLVRASEAGIDLGQRNLPAYVERLTARPAFSSALKRVGALAEAA